ncbi:MAG: VCBS repeat-containing protein [Verrucomicrobia bacterium]|nr:VCBS repeat-containing protein [Verrucomicrobiota bacterium]
MLLLKFLRTGLGIQKSWLWLAILLGFQGSAALAFNLDGQTDIVWQNRAAGLTTVWFMNLLAFADNGWVTNDFSAGWQAVATADFNRDGQTDLLWRSPSTGQNELWLMRGTNRIGRHSLAVGATNFYVVGTGDFNADGYADILWRDHAHDLTAVWFLNGTNWTGQVGRVEPNGDPAWRAVATGDCNQDGEADIYWRHSRTGRNAVWIMRGTNVTRLEEIRAELDLGFQLVTTGQFNPLGHTDLLWRHTNGQNVVWLMRGTNHLSTVALPTETNRNWRIVGVGGYTNGMMLTASADAASRSVTLAWRHGPANWPTIRRRLLDETRWTTQAVNYAPYRLTNSNLELGQRYEFDVGGQYLLAGLNAAPVEQRGKVLLIVENSAAKALARELDTFRADLVGDGWSVIRTNVPRHNDRGWRANTNAIASIKSFVTNLYSADRATTRSILLVGHVPIPYSGFHNPDGHGGRTLPADGYYGDVDGIYTDARVNYTSGVSGAPESRHANLVGDGKFDQNRYPPNPGGAARLELAVGRIDFAKLPVFKSQSEIELLRRYFDKNHRYRHKQLVLPERVTAGTFFPMGLNWEAYAQATKLGSRMFGASPQSVVDGDPFLRGNASVWGILCGYGLPYGVRGQPGAYHESAHLADPAKAPRLLFASLFASYCVDFDYADNFMRAFLGAQDAGLVVTWFRPVSVENVPLAFETLGLGEPVGSGFLRMINDNPDRTAHMTYLALLGDPTLRLQILAPPSALIARGKGKVDLTWTASPEPGAQYFVYRSTSQWDGPWKRLTSAPVTATRFTDAAAPTGPKLYQVRALKLVETGSGTYTNLSQGVFSKAIQ